MDALEEVAKSTPPASGPIAAPAEKLDAHTPMAKVRWAGSRNMLRISDDVEGAAQEREGSDQHLGAPRKRGGTEAEPKEPPLLRLLSSFLLSQVFLDLLFPSNPYRPRIYRAVAPPSIAKAATSLRRVTRPDEFGAGTSSSPSRGTPDRRRYMVGVYQPPTLVMLASYPIFKPSWVHSQLAVYESVDAFDGIAGPGSAASTES
jgi:hypothetical protein